MQLLKKNRYKRRPDSKQSSSLKQNMFFATGEKPFKCELCDYRAINQTFVKRHMIRMHRPDGDNDADAPLHVCDICGKTFKVKQRYLKRLSLRLLH